MNSVNRSLKNRKHHLGNLKKLNPNIQLNFDFYCLSNVTLKKLNHNVDLNFVFYRYNGVRTSFKQLKRWISLFIFVDVENAHIY